MKGLIGFCFCDFKFYRVVFKVDLLQEGKQLRGRLARIDMLILLNKGIEKEFWFCSIVNNVATFDAITDFSNKSLMSEFFFNLLYFFWNSFQDTEP